MNKVRTTRREQDADDVETGFARVANLVNVLVSRQR